MKFLLRLSIIALISVAAALLFVMVMCWVSDPSQAEIRNLFLLIIVAVCCVLIPNK